MKYRIAVGVLLVASVLDLLTTVVGIQWMGLVEVNVGPATVLRDSGAMGLVYLTIGSLAIILGLTGLLRRLSAPYSSSLAMGTVILAGVVKATATLWNMFLILSS